MAAIHSSRRCGVMGVRMDQWYQRPGDQI
jgi:hypothetical protein